MLHYDILDSHRLEILPLFGAFKKDFYLAGGTGLSLQLGHRDSIDFDFFTQNSFDPDNLLIDFQKVFKKFKLQVIQKEKNTLTIIVDKTIKVSFFAYPYPLLDPVLDEPHIKVASVLDIGCMKCSAIVNRTKIKDYIDLYYILRLIPLSFLLDSLKSKMPILDRQMVLKSLVYLEDLDDEPIKFKKDNFVSKAEIEKFLQKEVKSVVGAY